MTPSELEKNKPAPPADAGKPSLQSSAVPGGTPREQYAQAFDLLQKGRHDEAVTGFQDFIQKHPQDSLTPNARYWLGEAYYAKADYAQAATTFLDGYEKNKTGQKAPDTLLKLGMALGQLDKKREACATFQELERAFPQAPAAVKSKAAEEKKRLACR
jgi:tol-pal system protein YbgF